MMRAGTRCYARSAYKSALVCMCTSLERSHRDIYKCHAILSARVCFSRAICRHRQSRCALSVPGPVPRRFLCSTTEKGSSIGRRISEIDLDRAEDHAKSGKDAQTHHLVTGPFLSRYHLYNSEAFPTIGSFRSVSSLNLVLIITKTDNVDES